MKRRFIKLFVMCVSCALSVSVMAQDTKDAGSYKMEPVMYEKVMEGATAETRSNYQTIVNFVESLCNTYIAKDMGLLEKVFGNDALVLSGNEVKAIPNAEEKKDNGKISYLKQSKKMYLATVRQLFKAGDVKPVLESMKINQHPTKKELYGVTLKHGWEARAYSNKGYLFMMWDFSQQEQPKIVVRTWQPDTIDGNSPLPEEEVFSLEDFEIK